MSSPEAATVPWSNRARARARRLAVFGPALALMALFIVTGIRGVDFGQHWDEMQWQVEPVRDMVAEGLLLPRASIYPTLAKWFVLLPSIPVGIRTALKPGVTPPQVQAAMLATIRAPQYLLIVRGLFIVVSALAILWVYGAVLTAGRPWWEAFIAACGLGLSWEYAYHARWVATDCLVVQFSALELWFLALFLFRGHRRGWLYAAAIAAGLGTGAKFPGVLLLPPVMLASLLGLHDLGELKRQWRSQLAQLVALGATAFAAYLVSTPATVLDPFAFAEKLAWISDYYKAGHWMHSVPGPWTHWKLVLVYLSLVYFSPYLPVAVLLFACTVAGAALWLRADRRFGALLIFFPVVFLCYFCFRYKAVIARNYLLIVPFLCVMMARTIGEGLLRLPRRWLRIGLGVALGAVGLGQAVFLVKAGESIRHVDPKAEVRDAFRYLAGHPKLRFRISPRVRGIAALERLALPPNVAGGPGMPADAVVLFAIAEGPDSFHWKVNDPWLTLAIFGPKEVDFNWYSGWSGHDRVVVMTLAKARETGVDLAR